MPWDLKNLLILFLQRGVLHFSLQVWKRRRTANEPISYSETNVSNLFHISSPAPFHSPIQSFHSFSLFFMCFALCSLHYTIPLYTFFKKTSYLSLSSPLQKTIHSWRNKSSVFSANVGDVDRMREERGSMLERLLLLLEDVVMENLHDHVLWRSILGCYVLLYFSRLVIHFILVF